MPRGVAEEDREPAVGQRLELVEVAPDGVRDAVEGAQLEARDGGERLRDELGLELPRHDELVAEAELVDELEADEEEEQDRADEER